MLPLFFTYQKLLALAVVAGGSAAVYNHWEEIKMSAEAIAENWDDIVANVQAHIEKHKKQRLGHAVPQGGCPAYSEDQLVFDIGDDPSHDSSDSDTSVERGVATTSEDTRRKRRLRRRSRNTAGNSTDTDDASTFPSFEMPSMVNSSLSSTETLSASHSAYADSDCSVISHVPDSADESYSVISDLSMPSSHTHSEIEII